MRHFAIDQVDIDELYMAGTSARFLFCFSWLELVGCGVEVVANRRAEAVGHAWLAHRLKTDVQTREQRELI